MDATTKETLKKAQMYEKNKPPVQCTFRVYHYIYSIPVDHPETDVGERFYDYIDGMHGEFAPISSELLLETKDRAEAERKIDKLGEEMKELVLNRLQMPETVKIEQYDLRVQLNDEPDDCSLEDRLTAVIIENDPNIPW